MFQKWTRNTKWARPKVGKVVQVSGQGPGQEGGTPTHEVVILILV